MIKAVIFDWNGVLTDSLELDHSIFLKQAERQKLKVPQSLDFYRNMFSTNVFDELHKIGMSTDEATEEHYQKTYLENMGSDIFPGIKNMVETLRGKYKLGIITSNYLSCVNKFLEINEMNKLFDAILTCDVSRRKEKKIQMFLEKFSLEKGEVIFVGDTLSDLEACRNAGVSFIAAAWGYQNEKDFSGHNPDFVAQKPQDIINILEEIDSNG